MDAARIRELLVELGRRLAAQGLTAELYVVGGAAIALAYDERRATRDIDAVFEPKAAIYREAASMADQLGLSEGWLNDGVKGFLAGADPEHSIVLEAPGISCADRLGLTSAAEVLEVAAAVFGDRLDVGARFFVEELFAPG